MLTFRFVRAKSDSSSQKLGVEMRILKRQINKSLHYFKAFTRLYLDSKLHVFTNKYIISSTSCCVSLYMYSVP